MNILFIKVMYVSHHCITTEQCRSDVCVCVCVCVCVWGGGGGGGGGSGKVLELSVVQRRYMSARCPQGYRHRFKLVFLNILHLFQNNNSKQ